MFTAATQQSNTKLVLVSGEHDAGTISNPTFNIRDSVRTTPGTKIMCGIDKMYFTNPVFAYSDYMTLDMTLTHSGTNSKTLNADDFDGIDLAW